MNRLMYLACLFVLKINGVWSQQQRSTAYHMDQMFMASTEDKIEVLYNGDTVLISNYRNPNVKLFSPTDFEKMYKGTPLFRNAWFEGSYRLENSSNYAKGKIAFDQKKQIIYLATSGQSIEIKPFEFTIENIVFTKYNKIFDGLPEGYFQKIIDGKYILMIHYNCKYQAANIGQSTGYEQSRDGYEGYFNKSMEYYIVKDKYAQLVSKKLSIFGNDESKVANYAKQNNLTIKKSQDLIRIIHYLNE